LGLGEGLCGQGDHGRLVQEDVCMLHVNVADTFKGPDPFDNPVPCHAN